VSVGRGSAGIVHFSYSALGGPDEGEEQGEGGGERPLQIPVVRHGSVQGPRRGPGMDVFGDFQSCPGEEESIKATGWGYERARRRVLAHVDGEGKGHWTVGPL